MSLSLPTSNLYPSSPLGANAPAPKAAAAPTPASPTAGAPGQSPNTPGNLGGLYGATGGNPSGDLGSLLQQIMSMLTALLGQLGGGSSQAAMQNGAQTPQPGAGGKAEEGGGGSCSGKAGKAAKGGGGSCSGEGGGSPEKAAEGGGGSCSGKKGGKSGYGEKAGNPSPEKAPQSPYSPKGEKSGKGGGHCSGKGGGQPSEPEQGGGGSYGGNSPYGGGSDSPSGESPYGGQQGGDTPSGNQPYGGPEGEQTPTGNQSYGGEQTPTGNQSYGGEQTPTGNQPYGGEQTPTGNQPYGGQQGGETPNGNNPYGGQQGGNQEPTGGGNGPNTTGKVNGGGSKELVLQNNEKTPIKIGMFENTGPGMNPNIDDPNNVFDLQPGETKKLSMPESWQGRAQKLGGKANDPATWAEINYENKNGQDKIWYDNSVIRGYNSAVTMKPTDGSGPTKGHSNSILGNAPADAVTTDSGGNKVIKDVETYQGGVNQGAENYLNKAIGNNNAYVRNWDHNAVGTTDSKSLTVAFNPA